MPHSRLIKTSVLTLAAMLLALTFGLSGDSAVAQGGPIPLRIEVAVTGQLTAAAPTAIYSFYAYESLRMAVVFDVTAGDMQPSLVVLGQDQQTVLAGSTGPNNNGVVVTFPAQGEYYVGLTAESGTSATYRLMINADPALPLNPFVMQAYIVAGEATECAQNTPVAYLPPSGDLNVCFVMDQIEDSTQIDVQWMSPSGEIVNEEGGTLDASVNRRALLTGLVYPGTPFEAGWWQVHFLINGELARIQWVPVF